MVKRRNCEEFGTFQVQPWCSDYEVDILYPKPTTKVSTTARRERRCSEKKLQKMSSQMTVLRAFFLDSLPSNHEVVQHQLTEDDSNLTEARSETLLRWRFAFLQRHRRTRRTGSREIAFHYAARKFAKSKGKSRKPTASDSKRSTAPAGSTRNE